MAHVTIAACVCRSLKSDRPDKVNAVCDFACPVSSYPAVAVGYSPMTDQVMLSVGSHSVDTFMIDGGSTCHVLGFEGAAIDASLHNKRSVDITIVVGGAPK